MMSTASAVARSAGLKGYEGYRTYLNSGSIIKVSPGIMGGYEGLKYWTEGIRYTAVLTSEDIIAAGVLNKLRRQVRSSRDVAVIDTITHRFPCTAPELSTVDNKVEDGGDAVGYCTMY